MTTTTTKASTSYFSNRLDTKNLFTNPSNIQLQDDNEINGTSEENLSPDQKKIYNRVKRVCIISHKLVELYKMMTYYRKFNLNNDVNFNGNHKIGEAILMLVVATKLDK